MCAQITSMHRWQCNKLECPHSPHSWRITLPSPACRLPDAGGRPLRVWGHCRAPRRGGRQLGAASSFGSGPEPCASSSLGSSLEPCASCSVEICPWECPTPPPSKLLQPSNPNPTQIAPLIALQISPAGSPLVASQPVPLPLHSRKGRVGPLWCASGLSMAAGLAEAGMRCHMARELSDGHPILYRLVNAPRARNF